MGDKIRVPRLFQAHVELSRAEIMVEELVRADIYAGRISQLSLDKIKRQIQVCHNSIASARKEMLK